MNYKRDEFIAILKKCMGSLSQIEYARRSGIGPVTLNRILKNENQRPSKITLKKIVKTSPEITNYEELLQVCGYIANEQDYADMVPFVERARSVVERIKRTLPQSVGEIRIYETLKDFIREYEISSSDEHFMGMRISKEEEYEGNRHPGTEYYSVVSFQFADDTYECRVWLVIYYVKTVGGKIIVTDTAMDGESLVEAGAISQNAIDMLYEDGEDINSMEYFYTIRRSPKSKSAERRLLDAIFGKDSETYNCPVFGFGFYMPFFPSTFSRFLLEHEQSFCKSEEEHELFAKFQKKDVDPELLFEDYQDEMTLGEGFQSVVANIMKRETGLPFQFFESDEENKNIPLIIIPDDHEEYVPQKLVDIVRPYASELGIKKFGKCLFYQEREIDQKEIYDTYNDKKGDRDE